jgi:hypothetical protein
MRKLFLGALLVAAAAGLAPAYQDPAAPQAKEEIPNMGRAPQGPDGLGRLDARVTDSETGQPVQGAQVKLGSTRSDGFFCESWNSTDERGVAVLPPLHMGSLRLIVKAKGYETQKLTIDPATLNEPVRVTLKKSD